MRETVLFWIKAGSVAAGIILACYGWMALSLAIIENSDRQESRYAIKADKHKYQLEYAITCSKFLKQNGK